MCDSFDRKVQEVLGKIIHKSANFFNSVRLDNTIYAYFTQSKKNVFKCTRIFLKIISERERKK